MRAVDTILIASLNRGKMEEFQELFSFHKLKLGSLESSISNSSALGSIERHSDGVTYQENALRKAIAVFRATGRPTIADDSGLEIDALHGKPGVCSALTKGAKILEQMKGLQNRSARFRCCLVLVSTGIEIFSEGICEGVIAEAPRGTNGFGFDSIFLPSGADGKTLAELSQEEKNKISHRYYAVENLVKKIKKNEIQLVRP